MFLCIAAFFYKEQEHPPKCFQQTFLLWVTQKFLNFRWSRSVIPAQTIASGRWFQSFHLHFGNNFLGFEKRQHLLTCYHDVKKDGTEVFCWNHPHNFYSRKTQNNCSNVEWKSGGTGGDRADSTFLTYITGIPRGKCCVVVSLHKQWQNMNIENGQKQF